MDAQFEFTADRQEALVVVSGVGAEAAGKALFGELPAAGLLRYTAWSGSREPAALCWLPPGRLEVRVPAGQVSALLEQLGGLQSDRSAASSFGEQVRQLQARLEAWSYSDSDSGSGPAESMAGELKSLAASAPSAASRRAVDEARDALDDGLPADVVAGKLDRVLRELQPPPASQDSGLDPSGSG